MTRTPTARPGPPPTAGSAVQALTPARRNGLVCPARWAGYPLEFQKRACDMEEIYYSLLYLSVGGIFIYSLATYTPMTSKFPIEIRHRRLYGTRAFLQLACWTDHCCPKERWKLVDFQRSFSERMKYTVVRFKFEIHRILIWQK